MRIALAQLNSTIGDFAGNRERIRAAIARARSAGADLVLFPELVTCGYPPLDLLAHDRFLRDSEEAVAALTADSRDIAVVLGAVVRAPTRLPRPIANAALALHQGRMVHTQHKRLLPTYDVFDEARYFAPGTEHRPWSHAGRRIGLAICEDLWGGEYWGEARPYAVDPVAELVAAGADCILGISASPWDAGKIALREAMLCDAARRHRVPIAFVNAVGANDELIFDGSSFAVSAQGRVTRRLARFAEDLALIEWSDAAPEPAPPLPPESDVELLARALQLGLRDYLHKQGFARVVLGLSGGIDSAVTAWLAARALGPENVLGLLLPGPYSSLHSLTDAEALARKLGIETRTLRIGALYDAFIGEFQSLLGPRDNYGLTQENLQARIRGTLLMAVSNAERRIALATGNKSELAVGYTTLYGDLIGGLAPLGDVLKRDVYALARHANRAGEVIPWSSIEKPPSAELAPDQRDSDSLPAYDVLDEILHQVLERERPLAQLELPGVPEATLRWVLEAIDRAEYKRRQAPLVLRVSRKAFGLGRRVPIVQRSGSHA